MKLLSFGEVLFDVFEDGAHIGGAPLNLSAHAAILGQDAYLLSAVGSDKYGEKALLEIERLGVKKDYIKTLPDYETGKCLVTLDEDKIPTYHLLQNVAYDHIPYPETLLQDFDVFVFGTLALREKENIDTVVKILENNFNVIYSDINIRPPFYSEKSILFCLENATIVKISDEELPVVTEMVFGVKYDVNEAIFAILQKFIKIEIIIITCGDKGAYAYSKKESKLYFCPAIKTKVESTVGAGDSFGAAFLTEYLKSQDIEKALLLASNVSAYVVSQRGAIPEETGEFLKKL